MKLREQAVPLSLATLLFFFHYSSPVIYDFIEIDILTTQPLTAFNFSRNCHQIAEVEKIGRFSFLLFLFL